MCCLCSVHLLTVLGCLGTEIEVAAEQEKWKEEFGEVLAGRLVELVEDAMEDYEWLYERRLRV
jgi:hypothetical protein